MSRLSGSDSLMFDLRDVTAKHSEVLRDFETRLLLSLKEHGPRCHQFHVDNKQLPLFDYSKLLRQLMIDFFDSVSKSWANSERKLGSTVCEIVEQAMRRQRESQRFQKRDYEKRLETMREAQQAVIRNHELAAARQYDELAAKVMECEVLKQVNNSTSTNTPDHNAEVSSSASPHHTSDSPTPESNSNTITEQNVIKTVVIEVCTEECNDVFTDAEELTNELRNRRNELGCAQMRIEELESHVSKLQEQFLEERKRQDTLLQTRHDSVLQKQHKNTHQISALVESLEEQLRVLCNDKLIVDEKYKVVCWSQKRHVEAVRRHVEVAKHLRMQVAWKTAICRVLAQCTRRVKKRERRQSRTALHAYVSRVRTFVAEVNTWRIHTEQQQCQHQQNQQTEKQHHEQNGCASAQQPLSTSTNAHSSVRTRSKSVPSLNLALTLEDVPGKRVVSSQWTDLLERHGSLFNDGTQTERSRNTHLVGDTANGTSTRTGGNIVRQSQDKHGEGNTCDQPVTQNAHNFEDAGSSNKGETESRTHQVSTQSSRVEHQQQQQQQQRRPSTHGAGRVTLKDLKTVRRRQGGPWQVAKRQQPPVGRYSKSSSTADLWHLPDPQQPIWHSSNSSSSSVDNTSARRRQQHQQLYRSADLHPEAW